MHSVICCLLYTTGKQPMTWQVNIHVSCYIYWTAQMAVRILKETMPRKDHGFQNFWLTSGAASYHCWAFSSVTSNQPWRLVCFSIRYGNKILQVSINRMVQGLLTALENYWASEEIWRFIIVATKTWIDRILSHFHPIHIFVPVYLRCPILSCHLTHTHTYIL